MTLMQLYPQLATYNQQCVIHLYAVFSALLHLCLALFMVLYCIYALLPQRTAYMHPCIRIIMLTLCGLVCRCCVLGAWPNGAPAAAHGQAAVYGGSAGVAVF
jgi:hypothetical protein